MTNRCISGSDCQSAKRRAIGRLPGRPDDLSLPAQHQSGAGRRIWPFPLSLTTALVALYLTGQSVNIMTLGGLALVIGTLLDNNIVVQENLHRHLEMGKDGRSAAEDSATELTLPILVATICILIVYLPIMFFSGIVKYLFVPLAMTVAFAMSADYVVSMSVTPVILARLYQGGHGSSTDEEVPAGGRLVSICPGRIRTALAGRRSVQTGGHRDRVTGTPRDGGRFYSPRLPTEFFPRIDAGNFTMLVTAPEGSRIEKTTAIVARDRELAFRRPFRNRNSKKSFPILVSITAMRLASRRIRGPYGFCHCQSCHRP